MCPGFRLGFYATNSLRGSQLQGLPEGVLSEGEGLEGWGITHPREGIVPERMRIQERWKLEELKRLEEHKNLEEQHGLAAATA